MVSIRSFAVVFFDGRASVAFLLASLFFFPVMVMRMMRGAALLGDGGGGRSEVRRGVCAPVKGRSSAVP